MARLIVVLGALCVGLGWYALEQPPRTAWITVHGVPDLAAQQKAGCRLVPVVPPGTDAAHASRVMLVVARKGCPVTAEQRVFQGYELDVDFPAWRLHRHFGIRRDAHVTLLDPEAPVPSTEQAWLFIYMGLAMLGGAAVLRLVARWRGPLPGVPGEVLLDVGSRLWAPVVAFFPVGAVLGMGFMLLAQSPDLDAAVSPDEGKAAVVLVFMALLAHVLAGSRAILTDEGLASVNTVLGRSQFVRWADATGAFVPVAMDPRALCGVAWAEDAKQRVWCGVLARLSPEALSRLDLVVTATQLPRLEEKLRSGDCVGLSRIDFLDRQAIHFAIMGRLYLPKSLREVGRRGPGAYRTIPLASVTRVKGHDRIIELTVAGCDDPVRIFAIHGELPFRCAELVATTVREANPDVEVDLAK